MRKYLVLVLSMLFILSFSATAFAIHETGVPTIATGNTQIILGGNILVRGWYFDNINTLSGVPLPQNSGSHSFYTTDASLTIDANVSDNVRGFMELETSAGGDTSSSLYFWGTGGSPTSLDTKPNAQLYFRQLWIQYTGKGLLTVPAGIKVGHVLVSLGEKQFLNHERFGDDAILLWVDPIKELHIVGVLDKANEGDILKHDDIDVYALLATYAIDKNNTAGVNYTYIYSDKLAPVPTLNFNNVGLHANGKVVGITYAAEADFQYGYSPGKRYHGYGLFAKAGYMLDPVNFRASFALGSGDSKTGGKDTNEFQTSVGSDAESPMDRFTHYTLIYERCVKTAAFNQFSTNARTTGIANTTYGNIGVDVNPIKDLSLSVDGYLLYATNSALGQSKTVGQEVDFTGTYKITKNLSYFVEAGLFSPGKFYKYDAIDPNRKQTAMAMHGLSLSF